MATELADNASHDDIQAYVDEVVQNVAQERDGEKIAQETDTPVVEVTEESSEPTAEKSDDKSGRDWFDDDLKAELAAYGISEQELEDFTSREEVDRALRLFDKQALESGRKALAEKPTKQRDEQGRFAKSETQEEVSKEGQFEITLSKDVYDDGLIDQLTQLRDHYESRLSALESRLMDSDAQAEEAAFDSMVDTLGHADLFGKTGHESPKELERRKELLLAFKAQQIGLERFGRNVTMNSTLLGRMARMVFAEEISKKDLKNLTRKISKQANGRQGGGVTRPTEPRDTLRDEMRRLYKELDGSSQ